MASQYTCEQVEDGHEHRGSLARQLSGGLEIKEDRGDKCAAEPNTARPRRPGPRWQNSTQRPSKQNLPLVSRQGHSSGLDFSGTGTVGTEKTTKATEKTECLLFIGYMALQLLPPGATRALEEAPPPSSVLGLLVQVGVVRARVSAYTSCSLGVPEDVWPHLQEAS